MAANILMMPGKECKYANTTKLYKYILSLWGYNYKEQYIIISYPPLVKRENWQIIKNI